MAGSSHVLIFFVFPVAGDTPPPVVSIVKKLLESLDLRKPGRKSQVYDNR